MSDHRCVGKSVPKNDALSLAAGEELFTDDFDFPRTLHLAILYSPHAHAVIQRIDCTDALNREGVVDVFHFGNVPRVLHTTAGQGFPEPSPYDTYLFDDTMRFVGDRVAVVAAESPTIARAALSLIDVEYDVLEPVFDPGQALSGTAVRIPTEGAKAVIPVVYNPEQNLAAQVDFEVGDVESGLLSADFIIDEEYSTQYASHCAIEPHAAVSCFDPRGRMIIISTTQVPFHVRRIVSRVIEIPLHQIRVIKPRIGGGFGGKQEVFLEPLVALASHRHKRPARIVLSRKEVFISSRTRHPMKVRLKTGIQNSGKITALSLSALMNTGANGSHALTVLSNTGSKVLPLFNKIPNLRFEGRTAYTNLPIGGAYRGYGATQGYFAFCQQIDMICRKLDLDIIEYYKQEHIKSGETSPVFKALGEGKEGVSQSVDTCRLSECIDRGAQLIDWYKKRGKRIKVAADTYKGVGMAVAMQGSGIPMVDLAAASMKMNDNGSFNLLVGATDLGTGSDTILAQIAAEVLRVPYDRIIVLSSDTDITPFDTGAYASSTTYVSGNAVKLCAEKIRDQIQARASLLLDVPASNLVWNDMFLSDPDSNRSVTLEQIAQSALYQTEQVQIQAEASYVGSVSPPPFIAQFAEVDIDIRTGRLEVIQFVSAVDCGQPINPQLVEGQVEGAVVNGLSYALHEEYVFSPNGKMRNPGFWDYKIFTAADTPVLKTVILPCQESTGPFGAKSVGEIAINGPLPAIANAIYDAAGIRLKHAPMNQAAIWAALQKQD